MKFRENWVFVVVSMLIWVLHVIAFRLCTLNWSECHVTYSSTVMSCVHSITVSCIQLSSIESTRYTESCALLWIELCYSFVGYYFFYICPSMTFRTKVPKKKLNIQGLIFVLFVTTKIMKNTIAKATPYIYWVSFEARVIYQLHNIQIEIRIWMLRL